MSPGTIQSIAASKDAALVLSLLFNAVACGAIYRIWKSRERQQDRLTSMLADLLKEMARLTNRLLEKNDG
jgi:Zn-dependent protease with chaperone function